MGTGGGAPCQRTRRAAGSGGRPASLGPRRGDAAGAERGRAGPEEDRRGRAARGRLRTNPGADVVGLGSYTLLPGKDENRIRLDSRAQDTAGGETIAEEALTGSEGKLFELAAQAGAELRQSLGVHSVSAEAISAARAALPSNQEAVRLYAEGRAKLWAFDFLGARDLLVKAVAADPKYPLTHSALSEAWWHLGYGSKARGEAQQAVDLSQQLPQEEQGLGGGQ